jgi:predicted ATPase
MSIDQTRNQPKAGPQGRLSKTGDNLLNVIQYLKEQHPNQLEKIFEILRRRIPRLEQVLIDITPNDQLRLQIKDAPFLDPISAKYVSDGTMKMLGYLILLHHPEPPRFIGIEEPENFLHPRLLYELAEECRAAAEKSQLLITSHSPFFVNGIHSNEVIILYRDDAGFSQAVRASDIRGIPQMREAGGALGHLWMEGHFGLGDPLVNSGTPGPGTKRKK